VMIQLGRVEDNRMVHMKLLNEKMLDRSVKMLMETAKIHDYEKAKEMLLKYGSVKQSLDYFRKNTAS
jgi:N-acetylmuramic acid 6-phosphate etherase